MFPAIVLDVCPADIPAQTEHAHLTFISPMSPRRAEGPLTQTVATNQVDLGSQVEEACGPVGTLPCCHFVLESSLTHQTNCMLAIKVLPSSRDNILFA